MFDLRYYQSAASYAVDAALSNGESGICLVIPTGGGKTIIMADMIHRWMTFWRDTRVLVLAHTKELVEQNASKFAAFWQVQNQTPAPMGLYCAGLNRRDMESSVIFASIQSVTKKAMQLGAFDVILVDEAHHIPTHQAEGIWRRFLYDAHRANPNVRVVGLSATPWRLGSGSIIGEEALLKRIAYEVSMAELIDQGFLSPLICKGSAIQADTTGLHIRQGEYIGAELAELMDQQNLIDGAVADLMALGADRKSWLLFCAGVAHSQHVAESLNAAGIQAASLTGDTPRLERDRLIADFKSGKLRALCNCMVLTEGFDHPGIDLVALLRPTKSAGLYYQMVGRGFRLSPGKTDCLILDFAGVIAEHGPVDAIKVKKQKVKGESATEGAPTKCCPECKTYLHPSVNPCPECGYAWPVKPKHEAQAREGAILSSQIKAVRYPISRVAYSRYVGKSGIPTLRVDYFSGFLRVASEWVCLEHTGYARAKAERWWMQRNPFCPIANVPRYIGEVEDNTDFLDFKQPTFIHIRPPAGKNGFPEIVNYEWPVLNEPPASTTSFDLHL